MCEEEESSSSSSSKRVCAGDGVEPNMNVSLPAAVPFKIVLRPYADQEDPVANWMTPMCNRCRASGRPYVSMRAMCDSCFILGVSGCTDAGGFEHMTPEQYGAAEDSMLHLTASYRQPGDDVNDAMAFERSGQDAKLALAGTLQPRSLLCDGFADQWMYDERLWGRVLAFTGATLYTPEGGRAPRCESGFPFPMWVRYAKVSYKRPVVAGYDPDA